MTPIDPHELDLRFFENPIPYDSAATFLFAQWQTGRGESRIYWKSVVRYLAMLGRANVQIVWHHSRQWREDL